MIVVRTPFRISFAGGGSDLPSFYRHTPGTVLSATVDKYMYIVIHPYFHDKIRIKYSRTEDVADASAIEHPIVRACLQMHGVNTGVEIASFADVPAGTGMGSSSSFTVGLLHALRANNGLPAHPLELAADACHIELDRLGEPIGKQDQYAAAIGGLNLLRFYSSGQVHVEPLALSLDALDDFSSRLCLFYVGQERQASHILKEQSSNMADPAARTRVTQLAAMAESLREALLRHDFAACGRTLHEGWLLKRELASGITTPQIEEIYRAALAAGSTGGKLLGAGGGGFLLLYCEPVHQPRLRQALAHLREMPFRFSEGGSQVLFREDSLSPDVPRPLDAAFTNA